MADMDKGFIEIGNINTPASAGVIRKLKSILDQHGIFHIIIGGHYEERTESHSGRLRVCARHVGGSACAGIRRL
jgi:hypothetical protein